MIRRVPAKKYIAVYEGLLAQMGKGGAKAKGAKTGAKKAPKKPAKRKS